MSSNWSSGTNVIKEVDQNKSLTLQMLELKKQGGGTEYFVRKNDVKLGAKHITQNGTYPASNDGKLGFSQVTVNVRGGNGSAGSDGKPTYTPPSGSTPASGIEPGGSGSAVVGTDPTTGNDVVVGVDSTGTLVTTPIPTSIVLVTPPTKMDYNDGDSIDLSGAVVVAKMADGSTWTSADYPTGHIPLGELAVSPTAAEYNEESATGGGGISNSSGTVGNISIIAPTIYENGMLIEGAMLGSTKVGTIEYGAGPIRFFRPKGYAFTCFVSSHPFRAVLGGVWATGTAYTYNNETVYYRAGGPNMQDSGTSGSAGELAWWVYYGEGYTTIPAGDTNHISLSWARCGDGKQLSTAFDINVTAAASSEYEDDEGGGAGHSF